MGIYYDLKRAFSELQLTGLRLARRKQEGSPALRAFMFIVEGVYLHAAEPRRRGEWGGGCAGLFEHRDEGPGSTRVPPRLPLGDARHRRRPSNPRNHLWPRSPGRRARSRGRCC